MTAEEYLYKKNQSGRIFRSDVIEFMEQYADQVKRQAVRDLSELVSEGYKLKAHHNNPQWHKALRKAERKLRA